MPERPGIRSRRARSYSFVFGNATRSSAEKAQQRPEFPDLSGGDFPTLVGAISGKRRSISLDGEAVEDVHRRFQREARFRPVALG